MIAGNYPIVTIRVRQVYDSFARPSLSTFVTKVLFSCSNLVLQTKFFLILAYKYISNCMYLKCIRFPCNQLFCK